MKSFILYFYILLNLFGFLITPAYAEIILPADIVEGQDSAKSWIKNSHFEKNVNSVSSYLNTAGTSPVDGTGGGATITCTRTTSSPISGDGSLLITKDAANRQGNGCSIPFTIDRGDRATMQTIVLPYEVASGTFTAGTDTTNSDLVMWVYDVTNAVLIPVQGTGRFYSNTSDYFYGYFQTNSNSTSYRLIFHQALTGTSAYTLKVDNVKIFKSKFALGTFITDMTTYTCVLRGSSNGSTYSNQTTTCKYRQVGDIAELDIYTTFTGTPGTGTGDFRWTIPSGLVIDTTKMVNTGNNATIGSFSYTDSGTAFYMAAIPTYGSTTDIGAMANGVSASAINTSSPITWATNDNLKIQAKVPILGWSSSSQRADGYDGRRVDLQLSTNAGAVATSATTWTTATFSTPEIDDVAAWNGTDTATIKSFGDYEVGFMACQNSAGANYFRIGYQKNADSEVMLGQGIGKTGGSACPFGSKVLRLNANDTIKFKGFTEGTEGIGATRSAYIKKILAPTTTSMDTAYCALYTGTPTGTLANALNKATVPTKVSDTHNAYSSGDYTISSSGFYSITAQTTQSATYANGSSAVTSIAINGTSSYIGIESAFAAGATTLSPHVSVHGVPLVTGQTVSVYTLNNGTSPTFTTPLTGANYFSICKDK